MNHHFNPDNPGMTNNGIMIGVILTSVFSI